MKEKTEDIISFVAFVIFTLIVLTGLLVLTGMKVHERWNSWPATIILTPIITIIEIGLIYATPPLFLVIAAGDP